MTGNSCHFYSTQKFMSAPFHQQMTWNSSSSIPEFSNHLNWRLLKIYFRNRCISFLLSLYGIYPHSSIETEPHSHVIKVRQFAGKVFSESESAKSLWNVGDICVCRWREDGEWYYAEIVKIFPSTQTCLVSFLYYENAESGIRLSNIFPVDAPEARLVKDEDNIRIACDRLRRVVSVEELCPQLECMSTSEAAQPTLMDSDSQVKWAGEGAPPPPRSGPGEQEVGAAMPTEKPAEQPSLPVPPPLALPPNWRSLLLSSYGDDETAFRALLTSWFMCGYYTGYFEGLKDGKSK
uniref:Tudor domain-containing protein n=1 Tax=Mesocestoides corti TaxID=53468 RepID=A0A5K3ELP4_MESCO